MGASTGNTVYKYLYFFSVNIFQDNPKKRKGEDNRAPQESDHKQKQMRLEETYEAAQVN